MSIKPFLHLLGLALVALVLATSGCGPSLDGSPREIAIEELPQELRPGQLPTATPAPASPSGPGREQIFMIQNNRLVPVERQIVDDPTQLMEILLLDTFPSEAAEGIQSAIFRGTRIQSVEVNELLKVAVVDLAPGSLDPRGSEQRLAFAQIVYSLTSLPGIDAVQFVQSDPENPNSPPADLAVQTDEGTTIPGARVTRSDFALLSPSIGPAPAFDIPVATPSPTPDPDAPPVFDLAIWMLDAEQKLIKVPRTIELSKEAFLISLLEGPLLSEQEDEIQSAIPPDAFPNSIRVATFNVEIDDFGNQVPANIAMVDLKSGSLPPLDDGDQRFLAAAQFVFTLTELPDVDQVVFSIDGQPIPMPTDRGTGPDDRGLSLPFDPETPRGLQRSDYSSALRGTSPTPTPLPTPTLEPTPAAAPTPLATPTPG